MADSLHNDSFEHCPPDVSAVDSRLQVTGCHYTDMFLSCYFRHEKQRSGSSSGPKERRKETSWET